MDVETWGTPIRKDLKVGIHYRWLGFAMVFVEAYVALKHIKDSGNIVEAVTPYYISLPWMFLGLFVIEYYIYLVYRKDRTTELTGRENIA